MASRIPGGWAEAQPAVAAAVDRLAARIRADSDAGGPAGADVGELVSGFYWEVCLCVCVCVCVRARPTARDRACCVYLCVRVCAYARARELARVCVCTCACVHVRACDCQCTQKAHI